MTILSTFGITRKAAAAAAPVAPAAPLVAAPAKSRPALVRIHNAIPAPARAPLYTGATSFLGFVAAGDQPIVHAIQMGSTMSAAMSIPVAGAMLLTATGPVKSRLAPAGTLLKWGVPVGGAAVLAGIAAKGSGS